MRVDRGEIPLPLLVAHVHPPLPGEQHAVAAVAGGHHAVEHVDAAGNALQQVFGCPHSHQIARPVLRKDGMDHFYHLIHHVGRLSHGKPSDSIALAVIRGHVLCSLDPQVRIDASLDYGEKCLGVTVQRLCLPEAGDASFQPLLRQVQGLAGVVAVGVAGGALVQGHDDVGPDDALGVHIVLRGETVGRAVDMRAEGAALRSQFPAVGQGEYLETAAVGQYRAVPSGKPVQASGHPQGLQPGPQIEMIGIAQDDLSPDIGFQVPMVHSFNRTDGTHGHKDRCLYGPVVRPDPSSACVGRRVCLKQLELHLFAELRCYGLEHVVHHGVDVPLGIPAPLLAGAAVVHHVGP